MTQVVLKSITIKIHHCTHSEPFSNIVCDERQKEGLWLMFETSIRNPYGDRF